MKQAYIVQDVRWCHDCNNCFMGCKDEHVNNNWPGYTFPQPRHGARWIDVLRRERGRYARNDYIYLSKMCQMCEDAPCIDAGDGAVYRREDGIVMIDQELAKGNEDLTKSCPYEAIYYNYEEDVPQKCTFCAHLLDDPDWTPGVPRCVHNCPTKCLQFYYVEPEEMQAMVEEQGLEHFHPEYETIPHVYYKNIGKFTKNFIWGGILVDGDCYENADVQLILDDEVLEIQKTNFFGDFKFDKLDDGDYILRITANGITRDVEVTVAGKSLNLDMIDFSK